MDKETVRTKMVAELDLARSSRLADAFGWTFEVDQLDVFVKMSPRRKRDQACMLKVNFDDFPRQAPSYVFVDLETRTTTVQAWPPGIKHGSQPDGICVAGTRECHAHYHKNDAKYAWEATKWQFLSTLHDIHRLMEKGLGLLQ